MIVRAALTPSRWPATRGRPRRVAQRPLPSMMMATCSGTGWARTRASSSASPSSAGAAPARALVPFTAMRWSSHRTLEGQNFLLLLLQELVDPGDVLVGGLLDLVVAAALVVFGDLLVLRHGLEPVVRLPAHVAHGHPRLLGHLVDGLDELLAALLGGRGHRETQELAVVDRGDPEVGGDDRLLHRLELAGRASGRG